MPTGFKKHDEFIKKFEKSKYFPELYNSVISFIDVPFGPVKSKVIETNYNIRGAEVRRIVRYARKKGLPIASDEKGYRYAKSYAELFTTIEQLEDRGIDILNTVSKLKKCFPDETQTRLAV